MTRNLPRLFLGVFIAATLVGCKSSGPAKPIGDINLGRTQYQELCVSCHGDDGKGSTPVAAAMNPKPRDLTDAAWHGSTTNEQIKKAIVYGGTAIGKTAAMPGQPQLVSKPDEVNGLVAFVRSLNKG
jgi:mono/diheme cytochrome c family protein